MSPTSNLPRCLTGVGQKKRMKTKKSRLEFQPLQALLRLASYTVYDVASLCSDRPAPADPSSDPQFPLRGLGAATVFYRNRDSALSARAEEKEWRSLLPSLLLWLPTCVCLGAGRKRGRERAPLLLFSPMNRRTPSHFAFVRQFLFGFSGLFFVRAAVCGQDVASPEALLGKSWEERYGTGPCDKLRDAREGADGEINAYGARPGTDWSVHKWIRGESLYRKEIPTLTSDGKNVGRHSLHCWNWLGTGLTFAAG